MRSVSREVIVVGSLTQGLVKRGPSGGYAEFSNLKLGAASQVTGTAAVSPFLLA